MPVMPVIKHQLVIFPQNENRNIAGTALRHPFLPVDWLFLPAHMNSLAHPFEEGNTWMVPLRAGMDPFFSARENCLIHADYYLQIGEAMVGVAM